MVKEELELELRRVEARMEEVDKNSRAYRAGQIIRESIKQQLKELEDGLR